MSHTPRTGQPGAHRYRAQTALAALGAVLVAMAPGCADEEDAPGILTYVTSAQLLGQEQEAVLHNSAMPQGSDGGPQVEIEAESTTINGGSLQVPITSEAEFEEVLIGMTIAEGAVTTEDGSTGPVTGYFEVGMPAPTTEATVVLTMAQALPVTAVTLDVAAVSGGTQGVSAQQTASVVAVGSGEVQVSVSWDVDSDVDLHVVDPEGSEVYYGATTSTSGGSLDLDSNAGCSIDGTRNENITWPEAPAGEYTVRVDYYDSCDVEETNYVVTVQLPGQAPQVFNGTFDGDGTGGGAGDGELITTFTLTG